MIKPRVPATVDEAHEMRRRVTLLLTIGADLTLVGLILSILK